ncbi:UNVERIFIED_CONTAM: hypothetical protein GTU68_055149 [Idotea baltica]|nr:hypothetical protein [Idotea baltica]
MLVLSRKKNESIDIGSLVRITVVKISGKRVLILFEAPRFLSILRTTIKPEEHSKTEDATSTEVATPSETVEVLDPNEITRLVLTFKKNEGATVGNEVLFQVTKVASNSTGIGLEGPKNVRFRRTELALETSVA